MTRFLDEIFANKEDIKINNVGKEKDDVKIIDLTYFTQLFADLIEKTVKEEKGTKKLDSKNYNPLKIFPNLKEANYFFQTNYKINKNLIDKKEYESNINDLYEKLNIVKSMPENCKKLDRTFLGFDYIHFNKENNNFKFLTPQNNSKNPNPYYIDDEIVLYFNGKDWIMQYTTYKFSQ